jgi:2-keto-4-pentenoate hydratase
MSFNPELAASILLERRINGSQGDRLPLEARPTTIEQAIAVQVAVAYHWCEKMNDSFGGWKCLQPSNENIVVAPIFTRTIDSVAPVSLWGDAEGLAPVEPEIGFVLGQDLPPRAEPYTAADVDVAISRTHMALELMRCRYADKSQCEFPEMLADSLLNQGMYVGPQIDSQKAKDAAQMQIHVSVNGEQKTYQGKHPNMSPRAGIYWLAEFLRQRGLGLKAGQVIITGSFAGIIQVPFDQDVQITYEGLGEMTVRFSAK